MSRVGALLVALWLATGNVLAHSDHAADGGTGGSLLPPMTFAGGIAVLGAAVWLDDRGAIDGRKADVGVALGAIGILAAVVLLVV